MRRDTGMARSGGPVVGAEQAVGRIAPCPRQRGEGWGEGVFPAVALCLAFAAFGCPAAAADPGPVGTEADIAQASQTYKAVQRDRSVEGNPLSIGGKSYTTGLGAHAVAEIPVSVPAGVVRLTGAVGVDDGAGAGKGSVKFRIVSGNAILWESPVLKCGDPAVAFEVAAPATRHRKLYLQADKVEDDSYDHADWVDLRWHSGEAPAAKPARTMKGAEFGIVPGSRDDQSGAFRQALQALREAPGSTLVLDKGDYHFWHTGTLPRHFHVSNHDQPVWQPVSIPLVDLQNVSIDGQGSTFLFHGKLQPVLVQDSSKVTLRGISIDYAIPHHSQGVITRVGPDAYEINVDRAQYPHEIRDGWFVFQGEGWEDRDQGTGIVFDGKTRSIVAGTGDYDYKGRLTETGLDRYRIGKDLGKSGIKPGDVVVFRHQLWTARPHAGVILYRATDTVLEQCPIHQAHGMGLLAQRSQNIRITGGGIFPRPGTGRYFSTNADATHFSNCRGAIVSENGLYEGMMDDAINVHATCLRIEEVVDGQTLRCKYVHPQSVGFEVVLPGEKIQFIKAKWLTPRDPRTVAAVKRLKTDEIVVTLDAPAPADIGKGDAIENADWFPSVTFRGNTVRNNRARGALFTTPCPVVVENNRFEAIAGSAILLAGDANGWYESGACADVAIRGNVFRDNLTSRFQFTEAILSIYPEIPDLKGQTTCYHRNVRIENNTFETFDVPLLYAISTSGITFRNNKVTYNNHFPAWKKKPFILRRCEKVEIDRNAVSGGARMRFDANDVERDLTPPEAVVVK